MKYTSYAGTINQFGNQYTIEREGKKISVLTGVVHTEERTNKKYIGFLPEVDIKSNDHLINDENEHLVVIDTYTKFINREPWQFKAYYISLDEFEKQQHSGSSTVFNISNATNSVIGNYNTSTINIEHTLSEIKSQVAEYPQDKEELSQIVSLLEMIIEEKLPAKKGLLSRFSDTLAKHSWLSGQIASVLIKWLTSLN